MFLIQFSAARHRVFFRVFLFVVCAIGPPGGTRLCGADATVPFDLPADNLERSVKRFAAQTGLGILIAGDAVGRTRTKAVRGRYTPRQALDAMLMGTGLAVIQDPKSGALAIRKEEPPQKTPAPPKQTQDNWPAASPRPKPSDSSAMISTPRKNLLRTVLAAVAANVSIAQTDTKSNEIETITLSPFTVNTEKDIGYIAADSLIGGRLATSLLKTPSDITVLTRDFLDDIGATDYLEASAFLTNTYATPPVGQDFGAQNNFRGLGGGFPTRNYFKYNNVIDFFNVERLESARGPNAILFGDGIVGGVINTTTKQAKFGRTIRKVTVRTDSEGSLRGMLDFNQQIGQKAAVRVNLLYDDERNWVDTYYKEHHAAHLAVTYRPWQAGELRFEIEIGDLKQNYAMRNYTDRLSNWNGVTWPGPRTSLPPGAAGVSRFTTDRLTYVEGLGMINLRNFGASTGSNFAIDENKSAYIDNLPGIARDLSLQPSNAFGTTRRDILGAYYQHQWSPRLFSEVAVQYAGYKRYTHRMNFDILQYDVNATLPDGSANPRLGQFYADAAPATSDQTNRHYDTRLVTAYELPITWWKQTLNAMVSRRVEHFFAFDQRPMRTNNAAVPRVNLGANQYFVRQYLGEFDGPVPMFPTDDAVYTWERIPTRLRSQRQQLDTLQLATVASFADERITFVGGVRRDTFKSRETAFGSFSTVTGRPDSEVLLLQDLKSTVFSSGLTYFPVPQFGLYANVSQTFNPIPAGDPSLYLKQFGQTDGLGYSGGIRFKLFDGKVVGSAGYYDTTEEGRVTGYGTGEINRIWNNINRTDLTFPTSYRDTSDINSKGWEVEAVANVTRNFRVRGSIGKSKTKQSNALPDTIRYFNENLPIWTDALSDPLTTNVGQVNSDIAALRTRIQAGNEGRALNGQADYTASIFGNYSFTSGPLKNLRVGAGASVVGRRIIGNQVADAFDYIKAPIYYTVNASVGYTARIFDRNVQLQLNVDNLLDYDEPVYLGVRTRNGTNYKDEFYYIHPRRVRLSVSVDF